MAKKHQLIDLKRYAETKGGKCLSQEYKGANEKYLWEDHLGNQWYAKWGMVNGRTWSPYLTKEKQRLCNIKYNIDDLKTFAESKGGQCLSYQYVNDKTKYQWLDSKNREFWMTWDNVKAGQWSPHEKKETLSALQTRYTIQNLHEFAKKKKGECLSIEYTGIFEKYKWKDREGSIFERSWHQILKNNDVLFKSHGLNTQKEIYDFIVELGITNCIFNYREHKKEIDLFIPDLSLGIELNGLYWHTDKYLKDNNHHKKKQNFFKEKGIDIIQITDWEWNNRNSQIKSFLTSKLRKNTTTVFARMCIIREVEKSEAHKFLNKYHILGSCGFKIAYGLYRNNELLMLVTIGTHHRNNKDLVLSRLVSKTGVTVVGGLSRLSKKLKHLYPGLITWIDKRFSTGESWLMCGWELDGDLPPDYIYYNIKTKTMVSKQSRRKKKIKTPEGMTEREHAKLDGLYRFYDCGKIRLKLK